MFGCVSAIGLLGCLAVAGSLVNAYRAVGGSNACGSQDFTTATEMLHDRNMPSMMAIGIGGADGGCRRPTPRHPAGRGVHPEGGVLSVGDKRQLRIGQVV